MNTAKQRQAAKEFVDRWNRPRKELGQDELFWICLLRDVYGIRKPEEVINFKVSVPGLDENTKFLDAYILPSKTLIEQKAWGKNLEAKYSQSNGELLTPFQQARKYSERLPHSQKPRWIIVSNFEEFHLHDMEYPQLPPSIIKLSDLSKNPAYFDFLVDKNIPGPDLVTEISINAGEIIGEIYEALLQQYKDPESPKALESLNILCVRLVFLLFAQSAGLLNGYNAFNAYLSQSTNLRKALKELFYVLDTPYDQRDPYIDDDPVLASMPYINGGLFAKEDIEIPIFSSEIKELLMKKAIEIDFSKISPTIFGSIFESCLDPVKRRSGGMHYTSLENIHKVIDPLFLDDLKDELNEILKSKGRYKKLENGERIWISQSELLRAFQDKLASITILDPAAGSGNFLTESYIQLRKLENQVIAKLNQNNIALDLGDQIKVSIDHFYGIEINDFAVAVAKTALWIAESQMLEETQEVLQQENINFFPLKSYSNIVEGNALRMNWEEVIGNKNKLDYIIGNPAYSGAKVMSKEQKSDVRVVFGPNWKDAGNLDYVTCWFKKSIDLIINTSIRCAFVTTNSICQGEQVAALWKPLLKEGLHIDFAYRTFNWNSESLDKAQVHCVIVGFSTGPQEKEKVIYNKDKTEIATNINPYLLNGENLIVEKRETPLNTSLDMKLGNQPTDNGFLILSEKEKEDLIKREPQSKSFIRPFMMGKDFINRKPRYCLWMLNADPADIKKCPSVLERIKNVKEYRLKSKKAATRRKADTPMLFTDMREFKNEYIAIPQVSSTKRKYIPIEMLSPEIIPGNKLYTIQNASLYDFGILTSIVHISWARTVGGRIKSDFNYSRNIVFNTFPWPTPTLKQKQRIEKTAQAILDARALYPNASLADLYDDLTMPVELRKAHEANDKAVLEAYGFDSHLDESEISMSLMKMYQMILENKPN